MNKQPEVNRLFILTYEDVPLSKTAHKQFHIVLSHAIAQEKQDQMKAAGVWQYLEQCGVLQHGSAEDIQNAKAEYWRAYRRKYNKQQERFTVSLSHKEASELRRAAAKHHRKPTTFLKKAAFCYMHSKFLTPDIVAVQEIRILLARTYHSLQSLQDHSEHPIYFKALEIIERVEAEVLRQLTAPPSINKPD